MDELVSQGLTLIEQFGAIAVLFMWLVWLIRANAALKIEHQADLVRVRNERDKAYQDYIDLLTEIKVNRPTREVRYEEDRPTRPLRSSLTPEERQRLIDAQERMDTGFGAD